MNCENIDLENKLELILKEINYLGSQQTPSTNSTVSIVVQEDRNKSRSCKQFDSLNYSLEMHKVRKNKKADFDIHNVIQHNIEDEDIDKCEYVMSWKELSKDIQNELIDNYSEKICNNYKLDKKYIIDFINSNQNKIKYNKKNKIIDDITNIEDSINSENTRVLIIKEKKKTTSKLDKFRKQLKQKKL